ncbi:MAG TPA: glycosyltransferase family 2 protein [Acidimicrobiales bacterium]|nr:glycosyltransferase family 2 protein [Acidimicrobiales bacterium]
MDSQPSAPPLVAVVVADQPGEWFEEALQALGSQDYPNQSVLVIDGAGRDDPGPRVAAVLPDAFLRRPSHQGRPDGFAAAANDVLDTVQGAAFLVFCHDDVAPEPDALRMMVEESMRSNAGIVGPKLVDWERDDRLLSVGLSVDKTGATTSLVDRGELDQEQHDSVRDVFAVSSACFLIRADLFAELGGFDAGMADYGADVDLCWRAQAAGARVVVAPEARVRHREAGKEQPGADPERARLEPRNHLRAMLKNYTALHLVRVVPQAVLATLVEAVVALIARRGHEARELIGAWVWNVRHLGELRSLRATVRRTRNVPDAEVRRLQARGSSRFTMYVQRRLHAEERARHLVEAGQELVESVGRGPARAATLLLCFLTLALLIGSRNLLTGRLPAVGQFAPFPRPSTLLTHFFDGWRTTGMGSTAASPPAHGILGLLGVAFLGHMGALAKLLVLGLWPVAALGAWRLARPLDSPMARISAVIAILAVPLPYNELARGRWTGLIAYAAMPWFLLLLARLTDIEPFGAGTGRRRERRREAGGRRLADGPAWRPYLLIGLPLAAVSAFVPGMGLAVLVAALGLVLGSLLAGGVGSSTRALRAAIGGVVVAFVLLLPWSAGLALPGGWSTVAGVARLPSRAPGLGALLRFQVGPVGAGLFGWALLAVAAMPLLVGRSWRFAWAVRFWTVTLLGVGLAWASGRGWLPVRLQDPDLLLAPAAAALAGAVAMGAAAAQVDLRGYRFSWRQAAPLAGGLALVAAVLPIVSAAAGGSWNLTSEEVARSVGWMPAQAAEGAFRVLWVGDPETLPLDGWTLDGEQGVAFATSRNGPPDVSDLWPGPPSGATEAMGDAVRVARQGGTARLGRLLAPMGVRYIVVPRQLSTEDDRPQELGVPAALTRALGSQLDLRLLPSDPALDVYENVSWGSLRSVLTAPAAGAVGNDAGSGGDLAGSLAVLPGGGPVRFRGPIPEPGTVLLSESPSDRWDLTVDGQTVDRRDAFGVANAFVDSEAGSARLRYRTPLYRWPLALLPFLLWAFAASVVWRTRARPVPLEPDTQLIPIYAGTRS